MEVEVEGVAWVNVEDGGFDFRKIDELEYLIFSPFNGELLHPSVLEHHGGEYLFIPKEKYIKMLEKYNPEMKEDILALLERGE